MRPPCRLLRAGTHRTAVGTKYEKRERVNWVDTIKITHTFGCFPAILILLRPLLDTSIYNKNMDPPIDGRPTTFFAQTLKQNGDLSVHCCHHARRSFFDRPRPGGFVRLCCFPTHLPLCVRSKKKTCRTTARKTIWKIALKNKNTEFFYKRQVDC